MCALNSLAACAKFFNSTQNGEHILPNLIKSLKDKVPNVRFYTIKLLAQVIPYLESTAKDKIKG